MADVNPDLFKVVQVYGGLKEAYFEVDSASAADVIKFSDIQRVDTVYMAVLQADDDGANVPYTVGGTDSNEITIGTGPSSEKVKGFIKYRAY